MYDIVPTVDKGDRQIGKTEVADRPSLLLKSGAFEDALKDAKIVSGLFIFMILIAGSIYVIRCMVTYLIYLFIVPQKIQKLESAIDDIKLVSGIIVDKFLNIAVNPDQRILLFFNIFFLFFLCVRFFSFFLSLLSGTARTCRAYRRVKKMKYGK